ncbi:hypothetical protein [Pseudofrankia sp. BMG5.37]|uniref:hypothetical protein n=1 Tax=Pseudofrankia sp. BMG5.37 TaxID=3050035 RepID=UPI0028951FD4|nr:hypothetical protein [Pseudofrankia sp. BMG5.37]MDT3438824.1 hypothetical protein [Pseudofrankia sp. BMG5.37]
MEAVAAASWFGNEVVVVEGVKRPPGVGEIGVVEGSGRVGVEVGAGVKTEAAEQALFLGG